MSKFRRRSWIDLHVELILFEEVERLRHEGPTPEAVEALFRALGIGSSTPSVLDLHASSTRH
jgi:hypothetical protein